MVNRADFRNGIGIPRAILLFLRVFRTPNGKSYAILESSPLLGGSGSPPQTWDSAKTLEKIIRWTLRQVFKAIPQIRKTAESIYSKSYPSRCPGFLASGQYPIRIPVRQNLKETFRNL